jgi:hypothetical protein
LQFYNFEIALINGGKFYGGFSWGEYFSPKAKSSFFRLTTALLQKMSIRQWRERI